MLPFKYAYLRSLCALFIGLIAMTSGLAQTTPPIGSTLTASEMETAKTKTQIQDGKRVLWVLSTGKSSSGPVTMLVNEQGVVGRSANEVVIANSPTEQTKLRITSYLSKTISVDYVDNMNITVLRFSAIADAAKAVAELRTVMPDARITLPVVFSIPRPR
jgi:hypothetical protein